MKEEIYMNLVIFFKNYTTIISKKYIFSTIASKFHKQKLFIVIPLMQEYMVCYS